MNAMAMPHSELSALMLAMGMGDLGAELIHERSPEADALPLVLLCDPLDLRAALLGPLTRPRAYGGEAADAFHVVAPSLPDATGSPRPRASAWERYRQAHGCAWLMQCLGYDRYGAYGNDFGAYVSPAVGRVERGARFAASDAPALLVADARAFFRRFR